MNAALGKALRENPRRLTLGERAAVLLAAVLVILAVAAGTVELRRQSRARIVLYEAKAARLAAGVIASECYAAGEPFADQTSPDGFAEGVQDRIVSVGLLPGQVQLLQLDESGYTVLGLLYEQDGFVALYRQNAGWQVWRAEQRLDFRS